METAHVPLLASTGLTILPCGLLLASKIDAPRASVAGARADVVKKEVISTRTKACVFSESLLTEDNKSSKMGRKKNNCVCARVVFFSFRFNSAVLCLISVHAWLSYLRYVY